MKFAIGDLVTVRGVHSRPTFMVVGFGRWFWRRGWVKCSSRLDAPSCVYGHSWFPAASLELKYTDEEERILKQLMEGR